MMNNSDPSPPPSSKKRTAQEIKSPKKKGTSPKKKRYRTDEQRKLHAAEERARYHKNKYKPAAPAKISNSFNTNNNTSSIKMNADTNYGSNFSGTAGGGGVHVGGALNLGSLPPAPAAAAPAGASAGEEDEEEGEEEEDGGNDASFLSDSAVCGDAPRRPMKKATSTGSVSSDKLRELLAPCTEDESLDGMTEYINSKSLFSKSSSSVSSSSTRSSKIIEDFMIKLSEDEKMRVSSGELEPRTDDWYNHEIDNSIHNFRFALHALKDSRKENSKLRKENSKIKRNNEHLFGELLACMNQLIAVEAIIRNAPFDEDLKDKVLAVISQPVQDFKKEIKSIKEEKVKVKVE